jgi:hypothetical protein
VDQLGGERQARYLYPDEAEDPVMTEDEEVAAVELRLMGMHPSWIEFIRDNPDWFGQGFLRQWVSEREEKDVMPEMFKKPRYGHT